MSKDEGEQHKNELPDPVELLRDRVLGEEASQLLILKGSYFSSSIYQAVIVCHVNRGKRMSYLAEEFERIQECMSRDETKTFEELVVEKYGSRTWPHELVSSSE